MSAERDPRALLRARGLVPKRSFGQNFLVSEGIVRAIADACVPPAERGRATVIELGAGTGVLTRELVERAARVIAVERDRDLVPLLGDTLRDLVDDGRLRIEEADAQTAPLDAWLDEAAPPRVLAGNLPYQITGVLLERAIHLAPRLERAVFMVQNEVAERLAARPSTKAYGGLTIFTQAAFDVQKVREVPPGAFHPPPEITSAVVVLTPVRPARAEETEGFRALVKAAFGARRKTLRNAWSKVDGAEDAARSAGIDLGARGETLSVEEFARVAKLLPRP